MKIFLILVIAGFALLPASVQADVDGNGWVELGVEFASGTYGTATRTNSVFVPAVIGFSPSERLDVSLEIPFVYQSNTNVVAGQYRQMQAPQMGAQPTSAVMAGPGNPMPNRSASTSTSTDPAKSGRGLGDIILRAGFILFQEVDDLPQIRPVLSVKFPTADEDKGLGTGTFEEGCSIEFSKWLGDWHVFVEPGYVFQSGSSPLPLKNYVTYTGGIGYQLTDRFRPTLVIKGSSAPAENSTALLETRLKINYQLGLHSGINGYLAKGMTDSSNEYGTGLAIYYDF